MLNAPFLAAAASATAETQPTYLFVWEQLEGGWRLLSSWSCFPPVPGA